ncbi:signal transduction histidine kinase [Pedobacter psychrotolerans]|uniref:histidine kinase n=1 Tax=Pedobacter psychrotolerans TaxID=1843235 RepID=A0A4R2H2R0_9SPHI|nr:tetratricopeptide repeat-containing sensor histidine kinase [Pedobacter psychrotolerans]TCO19280.1 signal transduction histidine kinase [Pedobacter psychrotolerans]GGE69869.1 hypothetical protein GCM10011413_40600 [Pedobacter psychrotolerans]
MHKFLLGVAITLCFLSCSKNKPHQTDTGFSDQVKEILKKVDTMNRHGQGKQALLYMDSAYLNLKKPSVKELFQRFNAKFDYYHDYNENGVLANLYADSMLIILKGREHIFKSEYANALFAKGDAILMSKNYNMAFNFYYKGQRFAAKNLEPCLSYGYTYRLGFLRYKQERYLDAIYFFKQAFKEGDQCDDNKTLYDIYFSRHSYLNIIGICFERIGRPDSAIHYYRKSLQFLNQHPQQLPSKKEFTLRATGVVYGNLGGAYLKAGQFGLAEQSLKRSIAINGQSKFYKLDALTAKIKLGYLYLKINHLKEASALIDTMQLEAESPEIAAPIDVKLRLYKLEWQYFNKIKNIPQAYEYLQLYYNVRDSIEQKTLGLKASDIDMSFKNNEQEYQLNTLNQEKDVQGGYLAASVVTLLIVILTVFILWYKKRELKALNIQITEKNTSMQNVLTALEQSQRENTRMMQIVAHDLRSPLAAAISITGLLKHADLTEDEHKMLDLLETSSVQSLDMISDLLNINTNSANMKTEMVELNSLVAYCISLLQFKAQEKAQNLIFTGVKVTIKANGGKIWRVVSNLIVNAIKFSPIGADIEILMIKSDHAVLIKISDKGIGIPIDHREKIFDMFTDTKREGTSGEHSFGIGLAISKQIVEAHHGDIWFESKVDEGSIFYVSLPLDDHAYTNA